MYSLRKSKKGFTLIELMVVVAIIGVLALLGLRLYTGQQEKAKQAIVKANAGTIQTLIQAELADNPASLTDLDADIFAPSGIHNPYTGLQQATNGASGTKGSVQASDGVALDATSTDESGVYFVNGWSGTAGNELVYSKDLVARR